MQDHVARSQQEDQLGAIFVVEVGRNLLASSVVLSQNVGQDTQMSTQVRQTKLPDPSSDYSSRSDAHLDKPRIFCLSLTDQTHEEPCHLQDLCRNLRFWSSWRRGRCWIRCRCGRDVIGFEGGTVCKDPKSITPVVRQFGVQIPGIQRLTLSVAEVSNDAVEVVLHRLTSGVSQEVCLFHLQILTIIMLEDLEDGGMTNSLPIFRYSPGRRVDGSWRERWRSRR